MTCAVLTELRVRQLLAGSLSETGLDELRAHLQTDCDACLDRLAELDGDRILAAIAGPAARLSDQEKEEMFEAVRPREPSLMSRFTRPLQALAALIVVGVVGSLLIATPPQMRDKGRPGGAIKLHAFAATRAGAVPEVSRALASGDAIKPTERVVFRYRLDAPAFVYVWVKGDKGVALAFRSRRVSAKGDHELAEKGQVLALDPTGLGPRIEVVALTSAEPIGDAPLARVVELSVEELEAICSGCAHDTVEVRVAP